MLILQANRALWAVSSLAFAFGVSAQTVTTPLEPGLWQVNTRPEMVGGQMMALPRNTRVCVTEDDVKEGRIAVISMPACQVQAGGAWVDNALTLKLACRGLPENAQYRGTLEAQGKTFHGRVEVVLAPDKEGMERGHMVYHQIGNWMAAECPTSKTQKTSQSPK